MCLLGLQALGLDLLTISDHAQFLEPMVSAHLKRRRPFEVTAALSSVGSPYKCRQPLQVSAGIKGKVSPRNGQYSNGRILPQSLNTSPSGRPDLPDEPKPDTVFVMSSLPYYPEFLDISSSPGRRDANNNIKIGGGAQNLGIFTFPPPR